MPPITQAFGFQNGRKSCLQYDILHFYWGKSLTPCFAVVAVAVVAAVAAVAVVVASDTADTGTSFVGPVLELEPAFAADRLETAAETRRSVAACSSAATVRPLYGGACPP